MTDAELGREIWPENPELGAQLVANMASEKREALERLIALAEGINLWQAGVEPKPTGAIICGPRQVRGARR